MFHIYFYNDVYDPGLGFSSSSSLWTFMYLFLIPAVVEYGSPELPLFHLPEQLFNVDVRVQFEFKLHILLLNGSLILSVVYRMNNLHNLYFKKNNKTTLIVKHCF